MAGAPPPFTSGPSGQGSSPGRLIRAGSGSSSAARRRISGALQRAVLSRVLRQALGCAPDRADRYRRGGAADPGRHHQRLRLLGLVCAAGGRCC